MSDLLKLKVREYEFPVHILLKRGNKNIYLRVKNEVVYITTPTPLTESFVRKMIEQNYDMIVKAFQRPPLDQTILHFLGKAYKLSIFPSVKDEVVIREEEICIFVKKKETAYIQKILHLFYAKELEKIVEKNILKIKYDFHIYFDILFQYKNVKTYFGLCYFKKRIIVLSTRLAKYDPRYILSVIYHEMGHFFYHNHSMQFYNLLEQVFPNYRKTQSELRKIKYNDFF